MQVELSVCNQYAFWLHVEKNGYTRHLADTRQLLGERLFASTRFPQNILKHYRVNA